MGSASSHRKRPIPLPAAVFAHCSQACGPDQVAAGSLHPRALLPFQTGRPGCDKQAPRDGVGMGRAGLALGRAGGPPSVQLGGGSWGKVMGARHACMRLSRVVDTLQDVGHVMEPHLHMRPRVNSIKTHLKGSCQYGLGRARQGWAGVQGRTGLYGCTGNTAETW